MVHVRGWQSPTLRVTTISVAKFLAKAGFALFASRPKASKSCFEVFRDAHLAALRACQFVIRQYRCDVDLLEHVSRIM